jgi:hypothetical protein
MDVFGPDWLQGGALAILVGVLIVVGRWINARFVQDTKRAEKQDKFLQDMVDAASKEREQQMQAWDQLLRETITSNQAAVAAIQECNGSLASINKSIQRSCELQKAQHGEVMATLESMK